MKNTQEDRQCRSDDEGVSDSSSNHSSTPNSDTEHQQPTSALEEFSTMDGVVNFQTPSSSSVQDLLMDSRENQSCSNHSIIPCSCASHSLPNSTTIPATMIPSPCLSNNTQQQFSSTTTTTINPSQYFSIVFGSTIASACRTKESSPSSTSSSCGGQVSGCECNGCNYSSGQSSRSAAVVAIVSNLPTVSRGSGCGGGNGVRIQKKSIMQNKLKSQLARIRNNETSMTTMEESDDVGSSIQVGGSK